MTLEDLGALGDLVGGLAVILSILYLARQVHQANRAAVAQTMGSVSNHFSAQMLHIAQHRDLVEAMVKLARNEPLNPTEQLQMNFMLRAQVIAFENYFSQYRYGFMDKAGWEARRSIIANILSSPGGYRLWRASLSAEQPPDFAQELDAEIDRLRAQQSLGNAAGRAPGSANG